MAARGDCCGVPTRHAYRVGPAAAGSDKSGVSRTLLAAPLCKGGWLRRKPETGGL